MNMVIHQNKSRIGAKGMKFSQPFGRVHASYTKKERKQHAAKLLRVIASIKRERA
jgi:hypothetical protein